MLKNNRLDYFKALDKLQSIILLCYIKRDYFPNRYEYEESIQRARASLFKVMQDIRKTTSVATQYEKLYEIIFSFNNLKWRVVDHSTFEVCEREFRDISHYLSQIFQKLARQQSGQEVIDLISQFSASTESMAELYRSALQVVSRDPSAFLFFVQDLIALREEIEGFL